MNFMYAWCLNRVPPEKREEWLHMLNKPLPGSESEPSAVEIEAEGELFMAAMGQMKGG